MNQKYDGPDQIPDEAIVQAFTSTEKVLFSARNFNYIGLRHIGFGDLGWWLQLRRVLPLIGITPQMLRPVFDHQTEVVKRRFPFNLGWFGLNKNQYKTINFKLPRKIKTFDQLRCFRIAPKAFQELARLLGKPVEVWREDGGTGKHFYLFTAHPSGEIVEATKPNCVSA